MICLIQGTVMMKFSLVAFQENPRFPRRIEACVSVNLLNSSLKLCFESEDLGSFLESSQEHSPSRKNEIWKKTCFEFFLKPENQKQYWEFNVNSKKDWNIYFFSDYREDLKSVDAAKAPKVEVSGNMIEAQWVLPEVLSTKVKENFMIAVSVILYDSKNGLKQYYAIRHPVSEPDFHHPDGFISYKTLIVLDS